MQRAIRIKVQNTKYYNKTNTRIKIKLQIQIFALRNTHPKIYIRKNINNTKTSI
jgi:hypothetical protein